MMNRGEAHQVIFEGSPDMRYFLSCVARSVRREEIEVHAYCILNNHFHLLVRSPRGCASKAMQRIQSRYVRRFNRQRCRDGSPLKGRFQSTRVQTLAYRRILISYIDDNPVAAGIVCAAEEYSYASAYWYARASGPIWLSREWVESEAARKGGPFNYRLYRRRFPSRISPGMREWVERRLAGCDWSSDPLDLLIDATEDQIVQWLRAGAEEPGGRPLLPVDPLLRALSRLPAKQLGHGPPDSVVHASTRCVLSAGILRDLCGLAMFEVSRRTGHPESTARRLVRDHRQLLCTDDRYAAWAASVLGEAMRLLAP
jgi:REP element-mobilizing transposase RayT